MGSCHRPRSPDHPRRGQQPVAVRPDGRRGHRSQPARRVGGVDELGLPRRARPSSPAMKRPTTASSTCPGVTFVASTGDYGAADPEYPAFSPNVVAVGGTSLTLNADNSYNSETGWGFHSDAAGDLHRLGRRHQPVRARAGVPAGRAVHGQPDHARRLVGCRPGHRRLDRRPVQPAIPATRSRSWAARACRRRPGRG